MLAYVMPKSPTVFAGFQTACDDVNLYALCYCVLLLCYNYRGLMLSQKLMQWRSG